MSAAAVVLVSIFAGACVGTGFCCYDMICNYSAIRRWLRRRRDARREYEAHGGTLGNMAHDWALIQAAKQRIAEGNEDSARWLMRHCKITYSPDGTPYDRW